MCPPDTNLFGQQRLHSDIADLIGPDLNIPIFTVSSKFAKIADWAGVLYYSSA